MKWLNNPNINRKYNYLYKITNKINNKIYIGVHRTNNLNDSYMGSGKILKRAIKKYGIENFNKDIINFFETYREALDAEKQIVNQDFLKGNNIYNLKEGGYGNCKWSDKALQRLSEAATKRWQNPEYQKLMKVSLNSVSRKNKISKKVKEWIKNNPDAHKARMLKINKNPNKIKKTAASHLGMKRSNKAKENISNGIINSLKNPIIRQNRSGKGLVYIYNPIIDIVKRFNKNENLPKGWIYNKKRTICHPLKKHHAKGLCKPCYTKQWNQNNKKTCYLSPSKKHHAGGCVTMLYKNMNGGRPRS